MHPRRPEHYPPAATAVAINRKILSAPRFTFPDLMPQTPRCVFNRSSFAFQASIFALRATPDKTAGQVMDTTEVCDSTELAVRLAHRPEFIEGPKSGDGVAIHSDVFDLTPNPDLTLNRNLNRNLRKVV